MCLTFGRPKRLLEEAVHAFLRQDYAGEKELLILNDFPLQTVRFDHPEVTVVNVPVRFRSVGEKRNAAAALCRHDLLAVWDDDDICLPHRLGFSVRKICEGRRFYKPVKAFVLHNGVFSGPARNVFHGAAVWLRDLFDEVGGYRHIGSGQDAEIENRFRESIGSDIGDEAIELDEIFYLYRWCGTGSYHLSAFGFDGGGRRGSEKVLELVLQRIAEGDVETGEILLEPHWGVDYPQLIKDHLAGLRVSSGP